MQSSDEIKSMHIAVYALSLLGGVHKKIHTEEIAQKCLEIAPDRFKWELFPYPDKELVRKALFHASEEKNGSLVIGRTGIEQRGKSRDGWQLSPAGATWIRENEKILTSNTSNKTSATLPKREAERLLKKIKSDQAYKYYESNKGDLSKMSQYMFTDLLNCSPDAPPETIQTKFNRLLTNAQLLGDKNVLGFLNACLARFSIFFTGISGETPEIKRSEQ